MPPFFCRRSSYSALVLRACTHSSSQIVSQDQMANGFERVYQSLADLTLDTPKAPQMLHGLMQQAMRDNVLPPGYAKTKALAAAASRAGRGT